MRSRDELLELAALEAAESAAVMANRADDEPFTTHEAVWRELRALRCTIEAASAPTESYFAEAGQWSCVELFGHSVTYGLVTEVEVAGKRFLQVEWPGIVDQEDAVVRDAGQKLYHPNAVYALSSMPYEEVLDTLRKRAGLRKWGDGSWRSGYEAGAVRDDVPF